MKKPEPCKICGRTPKVIRKNGVCVVRCKPLFTRTHWLVEAPDTDSAINNWNERMINLEAFKATFKVSPIM